jgi:benzoylformate decarboxylase
MTDRSGRSVLLEVLADEGVRHIFGNPGTTELPLMDELSVRPEFEYVLALQENTAVGMADGYAQVTGRPAFINLHTSAGLGGGIGNLTNAMANRTPLVVTAGQQDRRHLVTDPLLAGDLTGLAGAVSKWQHEVRHLPELATVMRRAFKDASTPPTGPVFVSIPMDVLDDTADIDVPGKSFIDRRAVGSGLDELADLLASAAPDGVAIVVGDGVAAAGAQAEVIALAEALGARVFGAPLYSNLNFPVPHPLWAGMLVPAAAMVNATLAQYQRVFVIGAQALLVYPYSPGPSIPPSVDLLHLDADAVEVGRTYTTRLGVVADVRATLAALVPVVRDRVDGAKATAALDAARTAREQAIASFDTTARDRYGESPVNPMAAVHALIDALPAGGAVIDEAITTGVYVRNLHLTSEPGTYFFCRGGGLGWGMPAALGVKLGRPDRPVLCVVGDGSAMYSIQSLWTAANLNLPVVFAVVNNRQYAILKGNLAGSGGQAATTGRYVAMDIDQPPVDYVSLARGMGVDAVLAEKATDVADAARAAFDAEKPSLIEIPISAK